MLPETEPILIDIPKKFMDIEIYPFHDLHYGNKCFDEARWKALKKDILSEPNRYVIWIGDLMENAIPGSKSSMFDQIHSPQEQKDFVTQQFCDLADRTLAINDGNHESNRSTKVAGLYPLYDSACIAGIQDKYRSAYAVVDIGMSTGRNNKKENTHYIIFSTHKAKTLKSFASCDALDGFDIFLYGHDHDSVDHPRGKLVYNAARRIVSCKSMEMINCGSFLTYSGGYAPMNGFRPPANKFYKIILHSSNTREKNIETVGFYPR